MAQIRSFRHSEFTPQRLARERRQSVSVCVPTRETAASIGPIVDTLAGLRELGVVDQVVVVDAASADGTAHVAAEHGAEVHQESELLPWAGPVLGKGDALWRGLSILTGEVVCFLDGDTLDFDERFPCGMLGPLVCGDDVRFVKGAFRRPFRVGDVELSEGGGRVNELAARPLLSRFYPALAGIRQPLAGEVAARRAVLEALPFATGYAVEIAMLIDVYRAVGADSMAEVDLETRRNRHQSLSALVPMAGAVLAAVADRLEREGRLEPSPTGSGLVERPPLSSVRAPH
jgi:glucosyl-3-phosphoglycerate synthase